MGEWNAETAEWRAKKYGEYATNRLAVDALEISPNAVIVDVGCDAGAAVHRIDRLAGVQPSSKVKRIANAPFRWCSVAT